MIAAVDRSGWQRAPIEPPPTPWSFPDTGRADPQGLVAIGADLEPGTLLAAYRNGLFPMPVDRRKLGWWSPDPRGIIPLDGFTVSRSMRQSRRRFEVRSNESFREVMEACGDPSRPHGWINRDFVSAYTQLHELGWAHSIEVRDPHSELLVGGVYGVKIGGLFAGESMFHRATDASKVALMVLVETLRDLGVTLFDVQWTTPHLISLGAVDVSRGEYLELLAASQH
jgi:leucyl/phenylalanyl-tRNA---protein transferase